MWSARGRDSRLSANGCNRRAPNPRPSDGYFVTFWRLLLKYPEILAWEQLWTDSQHEVYGLIYGTTKAINPQLQVGFHVWHDNSFSPFYRAEQDYSRLRQTCDFLKVVMYNNCAGPRLAEYIGNMQSTIFRDLPPEEVLRLHYDMLGYKGEASLDELPTTGLSADYVARETRRAIAGVRGRGRHLSRHRHRCSYRRKRKENPAPLTFERP